MNHQPAKHKEDDHTTIENPLVLHGPPLHHPNGITTDTQRISHAIQFPLRPLQHLPLVAQIAQHGAAAIQELVELVGRLAEESVLAQDVAFAVVVAALGRAGGVWVRSVRGVRVGGL